MRKIVLPALAGLLVATSPAGAATTGLGSVQVLVAEAPEDPKPVLKALNNLDGYGEATWDAETLSFKVIAEDSTRSHPRRVAKAVSEAGIPVNEVRLEFIDAWTRIDDGIGWMYSDANDARYFVLFSVQSTRFWPFQQQNRWGQDVPMHFVMRAAFGKVHPDGTADPDSVEILSFEPNRELTDKIDAARKAGEQ